SEIPRYEYVIGIEILLVVRLRAVSGHWVCSRADDSSSSAEWYAESTRRSSWRRAAARGCAHQPVQRSPPTRPPPPTRAPSRSFPSGRRGLFWITRCPRSPTVDSCVYVS